jgi:hypothetical protein
MEVPLIEGVLKDMPGVQQVQILYQNYLHVDLDNGKQNRTINGVQEIKTIYII